MCRPPMSLVHRRSGLWDRVAGGLQRISPGASVAFTRALDWGTSRNVQTQAGHGLFPRKQQTTAPHFRVTVRDRTYGKKAGHQLKRFALPECPRSSFSPERPEPRISVFPLRARPENIVDALPQGESLQRSVPAYRNEIEIADLQAGKLADLDPLIDTQESPGLVKSAAGIVDRPGLRIALK